MSDAFMPLPPASSFVASAHDQEAASPGSDRQAAGAWLRQPPRTERPAWLSGSMVESASNGGASGSRCSTRSWRTPEASQWMSQRQGLSFATAGEDTRGLLSNSSAVGYQPSMNALSSGRTIGTLNAQSNPGLANACRASSFAPALATSNSYVLPAAISKGSAATTLWAPSTSQSFANAPPSASSTRLTSHGSLSTEAPNASPSLSSEFMSAHGTPTCKSQTSGPSRRSRQPHLLDVDLEELSVSVDVVPDAQAAWYETTTCYVSLHPSSSMLPTSGGLAATVPEVPLDAPSATVDGSHLVSSAAVLRKECSDEATGKLVFKASCNEQLTLRRERLDTHFVLYLWCKKKSVFGEEVSLLGSRVLPLRDTSLYGRLAAWDIVLLEDTEEPVGEVRMRFSVASAPGLIQLPHIVTAEPTCVEFHWSPPTKQNGRPVLGYGINVLEPCTQEWITLCEFTPEPTFVMRNLQPGTVYNVGILAYNAVGVGENAALEFCTQSEAVDSQEDVSADLEPMTPEQPFPHERSPRVEVKAASVSAFCLPPGPPPFDGDDDAVVLVGSALASM